MDRYNNWRTEPKGRPILGRWKSMGQQCSDNLTTRRDDWIDRQYLNNRGRTNDPGPGSSRNFNRQQRKSPYGRFQNSQQQRTCSNDRSNNIRKVDDVDPSIYKSPLEIKIDKLVSAVRSQGGLAGEIVFIKAEFDKPVVIFQNAVQSVKTNILRVIFNNSTGMFELQINNEKYAEGDFLNKQVAKASMCETLFADMKKRCFYIEKKKNYEEVVTGDTHNVKEETQPSSSMEGSKAHQMLLKMGWGGKGLGLKEQGMEKTVADTIVENITKEGLGSSNVFKKVEAILIDFAHSAKVTTLAFNSSFTKEERAQIHTLAAKHNLRSKSEGKNENRRITVSKKMGKWDLVKELLRVNLENDSYRLEIPVQFLHLWQDI